MALAGSALKVWVLGMFLVNLVKEGVVSRVTWTETFLVQQCQEPCAGLWVGPERVSRGLLMVKAIILQHLTCYWVVTSSSIHLCTTWRTRRASSDVT